MTVKSIEHRVEPPIRFRSTNARTQPSTRHRLRWLESMATHPGCSKLDDRFDHSMLLTGWCKAMSSNTFAHSSNVDAVIVGG